MYDDMCVIVKKLVAEQLESGEISDEDRNLLSVAFKNRVGASRNAVRAFHEIKDDSSPEINAYRDIAVKRVEEQCHDIITLLKEKLVPKAEDADAKTYVFYTKMTADYYRYAAEATNDDANKATYKEGASNYYQKAWEKASASLEPTSPIRLGLALNFSVCKYEILGAQDEACKMAKEAFDQAISNLDNLNEDDYKDSTLIMQLLRDNLSLWSSEQEAEDAE